MWVLFSLHFLQNCVLFQLSHFDIIMMIIFVFDVRSKNYKVCAPICVYLFFSLLIIFHVTVCMDLSKQHVNIFFFFFF